MVQTGDMTFWDHLEDLRKSFFRILTGYGVAVVALFFFKGFIFDDITLQDGTWDFS